mmetsp:Transcript_4492/g.11859  ORF Transcript_4492/g.11859 Transcript_4492/m.11859 type:complete len:360 (-) Transcript_4492:330-1409(-)|eukprot:CAMPEP_0115852436 /NCGR_PEP_ID=MMETSP0287-20121206/12994_1 /TAXON_ID=412157 /ORGANISM="Chrysochromulina rotalis, Strain UIO044" /LENGTH=359 /DNA_ID=CAMNT_0003306495 /DNA_START=38 /DNA_END=1117 /DNA_ORIENTATION=-
MPPEGKWEDPKACGGSLPDPTQAVIVCFYLALNLCLNYYNAFLLGGSHGHLHLPIPIFYTMLHQVTIVIMTSIWCLCVPSVRFPVMEVFKDNWAWLIFVSVIYAASIATNNASFASISLTVNTIFKSAMPFPTMVFSYFIEKKTYSIPILCIVSVLIGGTLLAVPYGEHKSDSDVPEWIGYSLVIFSMVATAIRPVVSSHLMRNAEAKGSKSALTAVSMAFFDAAIAFCLLLPVSIITDIAIQPGVQDVFFNSPEAARNWGYIAFGCVMAGIYGPVTFYTIKLTSSLTFIIIGNFKQLFLLAGAAIFVDKVVEPLLWVGVAVTALASLAYSYQTNMEKAEATAAAKAKKDAEAKLLGKP